MKNYTLLQPFHFMQEPKPIEEEYIFGIGEKPRKLVVDPAYQKALQSWKEKYVEPEYGWINKGEKLPKVGSSYYIKPKPDADYPLFLTDYSTGEKMLSDWCDKEAHDKKLAYYNYHKVLFDNWTVDYDGENGTHLSNDHGDTIKWFGSGEFEMKIWNNHGESKISLYSNDNITISQFESITELKKKTV